MANPENVKVISLFFSFSNLTKDQSQFSIFFNNKKTLQLQVSTFFQPHPAVTTPKA